MIFTIDKRYIKIPCTYRLVFTFIDLIRMINASTIYFDQFPDDIQAGKSIFDFRPNQAIFPLYLNANAWQPLAYLDQTIQ